MAHTGIFATSDEILVKAGEDYDTSITEARINSLCLQAEGYINSICKYNFSDAYASLNADVKGLLALAESNFVAMYIIIYNQKVYSSRIESQVMLNVLRDGLQQAIALLKDRVTIDFMVGA